MFVTNSLCAPSRATLLTGQYSHTHGVRDNKKKRIPATTPILPEILQRLDALIAQHRRLEWAPPVCGVLSC
jgi:arylsulfatase A-like enzyme